MSSRWNMRLDGSRLTDTGHLFPLGKRPVAEETMISCPQVVSTNPEQILNRTVGRKESLRLLD